MADIRLFDVNGNIVRFTLKHATTGAPLTGLSSASSGLIVSAICDNEASATAYTVAGSNVETIATLGTFAAPTGGKCRFREVDATNHPGLYEFQFADARFSVASARSLVITVSGAANLLTADYEISLLRFDPFDGVRLGLTALPNAAADGAGGLPVSDAGGLDLDAKVGALSFTVAGRVDANATHAAGTAWNSGAIGAATLAADTITAAKIAADAIDAAALDATAIAEIADGVLDEAIAEPGGVFAWAGGSLRSIVGFLGALGRNKITQTATTFTLRNDADAGNIATAGVTDDSTTFTRAKLT